MFVGCQVVGHNNEVVQNEDGESDRQQRSVHSEKNLTCMTYKHSQREEQNIVLLRDYHPQGHFASDDRCLGEEERRRSNETEKGSIVPKTHTVAQPGAVMVKA
eukprot:CAMPEP_0194499552 /NCGR_PEP_ID=MMETSP0253-20130528/15828_1 /TAXON_ID=2966 /ORGANISM="Noctiluca scintillans" /LENGTH=102 /DNA_ID=CAMNT_0039341315 /DNA_START=150 /DNA_END=458 /DNA_ORIENTATION=+